MKKGDKAKLVQGIISENLQDWNNEVVISEIREACGFTRQLARSYIKWYKPKVLAAQILAEAVAEVEQTFEAQSEGLSEQEQTEEVSDYAEAEEG